MNEILNSRFTHNKTGLFHVDYHLPAFFVVDHFVGNILHIYKRRLSQTLRLDFWDKIKKENPE